MNIGEAQNLYPVCPQCEDVLKSRQGLAAHYKLKQDEQFDHLCFLFDYDETVSTCPEGGPVPIEWLQRIHQSSPHLVWAHDNQKLKEEAGVPGIEEAVRVARGQGEKTYEEKIYDEEKPLKMLYWRIKLIKSICVYNRFIVVGQKDLSLVDGIEYYSPPGFVAHWRGRKLGENRTFDEQFLAD